METANISSRNEDKMNNQKTTPSAIASLILGILSIFCIGPLAGIPAIICGHLARSAVKKNPSELKGRGLAMGGLVMGYFSTVIFLLLLFLIVGLSISNLYNQPREKALSQPDQKRIESSSPVHPATKKASTAAETAGGQSEVPAEPIRQGQNAITAVDATANAPGSQISTMLEGSYRAEYEDPQNRLLEEYLTIIQYDNLQYGHSYIFIKGDSYRIMRFEVIHVCRIIEDSIVLVGDCIEHRKGYRREFSDTLVYVLKKEGTNLVGKCYDFNPVIHGGDHDGEIDWDMALNADKNDTRGGWSITFKRVKSLPNVEQIDSQIDQEKLRNYGIVPAENKNEATINSIGMKMIYIPPGEFIMGSPQDEEGREDDEGPQHNVKISKGFYMGVCEVTQSQYETIMGTNPSRLKGTDLPVDQVNWDDAVEFCRKLSQKENKKYRLPTEAEWEYACRAGSITKFYFGDDSDSLYDYTWYGDSSELHPVGKKKPNAFGLYDMYGNVWEWCQDWYSESYYSQSPEVDPNGPLNGQYRVARGGAWSYKNNGGWSFDCRTANRTNSKTSGSGMVRGFRIAITGYNYASEISESPVVEGFKGLLSGKKDQN